MAWSVPGGDTIASTIMENLLEKASSLMNDHVLWGKDFEDQVSNLRSKLPMVEAILLAAENKGLGLGNPALSQWTWQFKDALEDADNVLDEMLYNEIDEKIKSNNTVSTCSLSKFLSGCKRKFNGYFNVSSSMKKDTAQRVKQVVKDLDKIVGGIGVFLQFAIPSGENMRKKHENFENNRESSGLNVENQVFGRVNEKQQVVNWLVKQEDETDTRNIYAFTILGLGGMGKTTLARLIYNDPMVNSKFDLIMWVCVSNRFNVVKITKDILQAINKKEYLPQSLNSLQETLKDKLSSKKFFLILDDVWNGENRLEWDKMMAPLKFGAKGSKILLTTRINSVSQMIANVIEREQEGLTLTGLKQEECLSLLNKHAFSGINPEDYKELQNIGAKIAEKIGGCPLVAKVLGGQLNYNKEEYFWDKISKENIAISVDDTLESENTIMEILRLSYLNLSLSLQRCFRFCSIFPQDYVFEKDELIYMWIGSGLIQNKIRPENTGQEYINHLVRKSFFDIKEFNRSSSSSSYVMHDLLHDLGRLVSTKECLTLEGNDSFMDDDFPETIRHLYLHISAKDRNILDKISGFKKLSTLIIVFKGNDNDNNHVLFLDYIVKELKCLRLLSITTSFSLRLPNEIDSLIHLRYLTLNQANYGSPLYWFPESVYKLYHLRVLRLLGQYEGSYDSISVNGMTNLINLRRLEIPKPIMNMIPYISKLESLQGSMVFHVKEQSGYNIGELKNIRGIDDLCITNLENVNSPRESREMNLIRKTHLKSLSLIWSRDPNREPSNDENIVNTLNPPLKLRELSIQGYNGTISPIWMTNLSRLSNLTSIYMLNCSKMLNLPSLGELPLLKVLEVGKLPSVKRIDGLFYGTCESSFSSLKELRFYCMKNWEQWMGVIGSSLVPNVDKLTIEKCPSLRSLSRFPFYFKRLVIKDVSFDSLPEIYEPNIRTQGASSSLTPPLLPSLEELEIKYCGRQINIQPNWFRKQKSLKLLRIGKCSNLILDITNNPSFLPLTLENLSIGSCGEFELSLLNTLTNLVSLKDLSLEDCSRIRELPCEQVFARLANLRTLKIKKCKELESLEGLGAIPYLDSLTIFGCEKLVSNPNQGSLTNYSSIKIRFLNIDDQLLLSIEPIKRVISAEVLKIDKVLGSLPEQWLLQNHASLWEIDLYNASLLESIPSSIKNLLKLKRLNLCNARTLIGSPVTFATSIQSLHICGCHTSLMEQYVNGMLFWNVSEEIIEIDEVSCDYEPAFLKDLEFDCTDLPSDDEQSNTQP